jgi:hypothetical protein
MLRVVAPAMSRARALVLPAVALVALVFLVGMVLSGSQPVLRQNVSFEAKGVLALTPDQVRRVEVSRGGERLSAVRTGDKSWATADGADIGSEAAKRLSMAVQMMHTSAPVNEIPVAELAGADVAGFELDPPHFVARLYADGPVPVLAAQFGATNPEGYLQYVRVEGEPRIHLLSRFVGEEWMKALDGSLQR